MQAGHVLRTSLRHSSCHRSLINASRTPLIPRHSLASQASSSRLAAALDTQRHARNVRSLSTKPQEEEEASASSSVQADSSAKSVDGSKDEDGLPMLRRPLGVTEKPTSLKKTWEETKEELMDQEKRMEKRKHLCVILLLIGAVPSDSSLRYSPLFVRFLLDCEKQQKGTSQI